MGKTDLPIYGCPQGKKIPPPPKNDHLLQYAKLPKIL